MSLTNLSIRMVPETLRTLAAASVIAGYSKVGTALSNPCRIFWVQNQTDEAVMFSLDGVNDHFPLLSNTGVILDCTANQAIAQGFYIAQGTQLWAKRIGVPTTGSVYLTVFYGNAGGN